MINLIKKAIEQRIVIQFIYENETRIVEPFVLGYHKDTNNLVLRSYRVGGFSKSNTEPPWRLFDMSKVSSLSLTDTKALSTRRYYNPNDKHMESIIANV